MNIVYLLESAGHLWSGAKITLDGANAMVARGHRVVVLSKTPAPTWLDCRFEFRRVTTFEAATIPEADLVVGTDWTTLPAAAACSSGVPVHLVQGYEGNFERNAHQWADIAAAYRLVPEKLAISEHLADMVHERFGITCRHLPNMIDHAVMFPSATPRTTSVPVRVGLIGPHHIDWKDIQTGLDACRIAVESGLELELVRVTNSGPAPGERDLPFAVEWHPEVPPAEMGEIYRTLDLLLGTSRGSEEGFFLPAVEAMACGVPCVLTDIPCFRDYGDGQHSLFVQPGDPREMAQALVLAARHPDVHEALRNNGLQAAARFTAQAHGDALEAALAGSLARVPPAVTAARPTGGPAEPAEPTAPAAPAEPAAPAAPAEPAAPAGPAELAGPAGPAELAEPAERTRPDLAEPAASRSAASAAPPVGLPELRGADLSALSFGIAQALSAAGDAFLAAHDHAAARQHLQAAVDIQPGNAELLQQLGHARYLAGDAVGAVDIYCELIDAGSASWATHADLGLIQVARGDYLAAIEAFEQAIASGGDNAENINNLGVAYHRAGELARARECFATAVALEPDYTDARDNLSEISDFDGTA